MIRQNWQLSPGALSKEFCENTIKLCKQTCDMKEAGTFKGLSEGRKTQVGWTDDPELMRIALQYIWAANRAVYNIDIQYLPNLQFGEYSEDGEYSWHHDIDWDNNSAYDRKLSICIQLSDPSTYVGGDLEFTEVQTPVDFKKQGSVIVFPSYLQHRVTKITSGTRYSLVGWMEGPRWR
jgi:PKHD-type hydroxylase